MAQRRMFSPQIVDTDAFLDMPITSQALYFHLGMRADDDGFVGSPKKIMKIIGVNDDDLKVLITKRFVLNLDSGIIVIKHWKINNLIRKDWHRPTQYLEEGKKLFINENGSYTDDSNQGKPFVNESLTQYSIVKDSIDKYNIDKSSNKSKKPYYLFNGTEYPMTKKSGRWQVILGHNQFSDFAGEEKEIIYK